MLFTLCEAGEHDKLRFAALIVLCEGKVRAKRDFFPTAERFYKRGVFMMKDKLFYGIMIAVCVVGVLSILALAAYTYYLYNNASIISYIANGG